MSGAGGSPEGRGRGFGCSASDPLSLSVLLVFAIGLAGFGVVGCGPSQQPATTPPPPVLPRAVQGSREDPGGEESAPPRDGPGQGQAVRDGQAQGGGNGTAYRCPPKNAMLVPIVWRRDALAQRRYWTETDLSKVHSTKERPVEVCGVREQLGWLMSAVCPDGSHPFGDPRRAHGSRVGNVGPGGRCGTTIIDLYRVPCKNKVFMVYMDLYNCGQGDSPFR